MNPIGELLVQAGRLRHAMVRDTIIDADGRVVESRDHHYLGCKKCELEKQAAEWEAFVATLVLPLPVSPPPPRGGDPLPPHDDRGPSESHPILLR